MNEVSYQVTFRTTDGAFAGRGLEHEKIWTIPFPGMGIVGSDGRRWIVDSVWYGAENHTAMGPGNTVVVRPAEDSEDFPRTIDPDYYGPDNRN